ncbi:MAG: UvrD-helicase domain-containing protein [Clostridia bacterium]|nr:UvrD-helicase domain-containing protein [Clostridia bacterium]
MSEIHELLEKLNDEQIKPVLDTEGAVLVIAGAGSGKTRVLTSRIAYLVLEKGVSPAQILAITFTNKAAGEMKERLKRYIGDEVSYMWVSTIHSMCVRILRADIDKIGYDKNFTIYDDTDKEKVLKRVFDSLGLDKEKLLKTAKNLISNAKNDCIPPEEFVKVYYEFKFADDIADAYSAYEEELARSNALDFDDLLVKTYELFRDCPAVADYYSDRFSYIHIDEFQDTNRVQLLIAERLALKHRNIFVVGDDDQSIYGWRGAKIENILSFDELYSDAKVYKLERNYRSTKKILELANEIIAHNKGRRKKTLWTDNGDGVKVELFVGDDENNEADYVSIQIKRLMDRYGEYDYKDFAVFMRVNALSQAFEQEFMKYGIPYRVYGGFRFFERKEIKDLLAYLKVINNPRDDESFLRCVSVPKRGIGDKTLSELREYAVSRNLSIKEAIYDLSETTISPSAKLKLKNFGALLDSFKEFSERYSVVDTMKKIIESTGFNEQFDGDNEDEDSKLMNIDELLNSAEQFAKDNPGTNLSDYLNSVTLSSDTDDINTANAVSIATIHSAKGLEFPCVFVVGLDERILPLARSIGIDNELEEERRLMYVAVTRAKERLYLTRASSRYMYGSRDHMSKSRFIDEGAVALGIKRDQKPLLEYYADCEHGQSVGNFGAGYSSGYAKSMLNDVKLKVNANANATEYKTGVRVKHVKFGEGMVISVKGEGDNLIADVAFKGVGIKSLSVKYAPMEIIK